MVHNDSTKCEMTIEIISKLDNIPSEMKSYIEKSIKKLKKFHENIIDCQVILNREKSDFITEINLHVSKQIFTVIATDKNVRKSIDQALAKIKTKAKRFNDKLKDHRAVKPSMVVVKTIPESEEFESEDEDEEEMDYNIEETS